jgi:hypothetical protein
MQSKLPLLPSGPGGVCLSAFRGPWHRSLWASPARASSGRCVRQARNLLAAQSQRFPRSHRHPFFTPTPAATAELTHCVSAKPTAGLLCGFFLQTSNHSDSSQRRVHGPHGPRGPGGLPGRSARGHGLPGPRSRLWILLRSLRRVLGPPTGRGGPVDALLPKGPGPSGRRLRNTDCRSKRGLPDVRGARRTERSVRSRGPDCPHASAPALAGPGPGAATILPTQRLRSLPVRGSPQQTLGGNCATSPAAIVPAQSPPTAWHRRASATGTPHP